MDVILIYFYSSFTCRYNSTNNIN